MMATPFGRRLCVENNGPSRARTCAMTREMIQTASRAHARGVR